MEALNVILPVLLYIAGFILLIVLIILGIRLIQVLNKVDIIVDNVEEKVNSLNTAFNVVDRVSDTLATVGESVITTIVGGISRIFNKRMKKEEDYYE